MSGDSSLNFRHRAHCELCEQETDFVDYDGEKPWCKDCGHNEDTLNPAPTPGGCSDHPDAGHHMGFGLHGGGYGAYTYCAQCCAVIEKWQEAIDE